MKRTPLRRQSKKRAGIAVERRTFVANLLTRRPWCEACPIRFPFDPNHRRRAVDCHELTRRSQGSPIVPSQGLTSDEVLAVCRECHDYITTHPAEAVELGLARWGMRR